MTILFEVGCTLMYGAALLRPVTSQHFPICKVDATLVKVCFQGVLEVLPLSSTGPLTMPELREEGLALGDERQSPAHSGHILVVVLLLGLLILTCQLPMLILH